MADLGEELQKWEFELKKKESELGLKKRRWEAWQRIISSLSNLIIYLLVLAVTVEGGRRIIEGVLAAQHIDMIKASILSIVILSWVMIAVSLTCLLSRERE